MEEWLRSFKENEKKLASFKRLFYTEQTNFQKKNNKNDRFSLAERFFETKF